MGCETGLPHGDSGTQNSSILWLIYLQMLCQVSAAGQRELRGSQGGDGGGEFLWARLPSLLLCPFGWNSVTWPLVVARKAGKRSRAVGPPQMANGLGNSWLISSKVIFSACTFFPRSACKYWAPLVLNQTQGECGKILSQGRRQTQGLGFPVPYFCSLLAFSPQIPFYPGMDIQAVSSLCHL